MEVSADRLHQLGIEFRSIPSDLAKDTGEADTSGFGGTFFGGALSDPFSVEGLVLGAADGTITFGSSTFLNVGALVRALQKDTDANVLATPHLLTTDNEEAEIVVAENVPFRVRTTATASGFPVEEIERKDVGLTLRLTPQISEGDFVKLNLYQEVSSVQPAGTIEGASDLTTLKRSAKTTVVVRDHQTVVIGGLISDNVTNTVSKVPWLGDIPLVGSLFRSTQKTNRKSNLLIIITPHVIRESRNLEDFYEEKYDEMEKIQEQSQILPDRGLGKERGRGKLKPEALIKDDGIRR
jgi:general secretion pathway protein D